MKKIDYHVQCLKFITWSQALKLSDKKQSNLVHFWHESNKMKNNQKKSLLLLKSGNGYLNVLFAYLNVLFASQANRD